MDVVTNPEPERSKKTSSSGPTAEMWSSLSPPANNTAGQEKTQPYRQGEGDEESTGETNRPKKSRPVDRRFSNIADLAERSSNKDADAGRDNDEEPPSQGKGGKGTGRDKKSKVTVDEDGEYAQDDEESQSHDLGDDADDHADGNDHGHWERVLDNIKDGDLKDAISAIVSKNTPNGKTATASEIIATTLKWKQHEPEFVQVRKNCVLTTEQARNFLEKQSANQSPLTALRAAARYKGVAVNTAIKRVLTWCGQNGLKTSSSVAIMLDSISKKSDKCEAFEQRVDRTIEYFMRTEEEGWIDFLQNTEKGMTDMPQDSSLEQEPGTQMLQQTHPRCERAWAVLSAGVTNSLSHTAEAGNKWARAFENWMTEGRTHSIGLITLKGKFKKQRRSEDVDDLMDRMLQAEEEMKLQMTLAKMAADIPSGNQLVGNLCAAVNEDYVEDMMTHIRKLVTRKNGMQALTLKKVTVLLKDSEARMRVTSLFEDQQGSVDPKDRQSPRKKPDNKKSGNSDSSRKKRTLTADQVKAITNYARENKKAWDKVSLEDILATKEGVEGWRDKGGDTPAAHPSAPGGKGKGKNKGGTEKTEKVIPECWYHKQGHCNKGDQCTFMHSPVEQKATKKPQVAHQREKESEEVDSDDDDEEYEAYPVEVVTDEDSWISDDDNEDSLDESDGTPPLVEDDTSSDESSNESSDELGSEQGTSPEDPWLDLDDMQWLSKADVMSHKREPKKRVAEETTERQVNDDSDEKRPDPDAEFTDSDEEYHKAVHDENLSDAEIKSEDNSSDEYKRVIEQSSRRMDTVMKQRMEARNSTQTAPKKQISIYEQLERARQKTKQKLDQSRGDQVEAYLRKHESNVLRQSTRDWKERTTQHRQHSIRNKEWDRAYEQENKRDAILKKMNDQLDAADRDIREQESLGWARMHDQPDAEGNFIPQLSQHRATYRDVVAREPSNLCFWATQDIMDLNDQDDEYERATTDDHAEKADQHFSTRMGNMVAKCFDNWGLETGVGQRRRAKRDNLTQVLEDSCGVYNCQCPGCKNGGTRVVRGALLCSKCNHDACMTCDCGGCKDKKDEKGPDQEMVREMNGLYIPDHNPRNEFFRYGRAATKEGTDRQSDSPASGGNNETWGVERNRFAPLQMAAETEDSLDDGPEVVFTTKQGKAFQDFINKVCDDIVGTPYRERAKSTECNIRKKGAGIKRDKCSPTISSESHDIDLDIPGERGTARTRAVNTWSQGKGRQVIIHKLNGRYEADWEPRHTYMNETKWITGTPEHTEAEQENDSGPSTPASTSSGHTSSSPRLSRDGLCTCGAGNGSHGCRIVLTVAESQREDRLCIFCSTGDHEDICECECDECERTREQTVTNMMSEIASRQSEPTWRPSNNSIMGEPGASERHQRARAAQRLHYMLTEAEELLGDYEEISAEADQAAKFIANKYKEKELLRKLDKARQQKQSASILIGMTLQDNNDKWELDRNHMLVTSKIMHWRKKVEDLNRVIEPTEKITKGWLRKRHQRRIQAHAAGAARGARRARAFVTHVEGQQRRTGVDSYAEISMILDTAVNPKWPVLEEKGIDLRGIGNANTGSLVLVPISYRCGMRVEYLTMRTVKSEVMPRGIEVLLGTKAQHTNGMTIHAGSNRLTIQKHSTVIDTEPVQTIIERQRARPLKVLELAGGMSPALLIMSDMGWRFGIYQSSEKDGAARSVAKRNAEIVGVELKHLDNIEKLSRQDLEIKYDLILASPPCKQFTRIKDHPEGMDSEDGELFKQCCSIINKQVAKGHSPKILFENVILHPERENDSHSQDEYLNMKFMSLKASECGGTQIRERRIATNVCDISKLERMTAADPNWMLYPTAKTVLRVMPSLMAVGSITKAPVKVTDEDTGELRSATIEELERLQGYWSGLTEGCTPKQRTRMIGNSWNYHQMSRILRQMKLGSQQPGVHTTEVVDEMSSAEQAWHDMTSSDQVDEMKKRLEGYKVPQHYIKVKETENIPYQVPIRERARTTPAREPAARAELKLRLKRGHLKLVTYNRKQWISRMFTKGKDRLNPETGMEAVRFLTDLRELNNAIDWPSQWGDECPTIENVAATIPRTARYFAAEDIKDAYEGVEMDKRSRHLITAATPFEIKASQFTDEELKQFSDEPIETLRASDRPLLVQWAGMPQGLASAAPFYNIHLADGLNQIFGELWREMLAVYVDDLLIHGVSYRHCEMRQILIQNALKVLGKELSSKCDRSIKTYGKIVGLKITKDGVEPDDDIMVTLAEELRVIPTTKKKAQHLIGVIRYSHTAFRWSADDLLWFNKAMQPMHEAVAMDSFTWGQDCRTGIDTLQRRMIQMPRAHTHPGTILDKDHCLVIISDACDDGVGAALWLVKKRDAKTVSIEDLMDPEVSTLVSVDSKILDKGQQKWATFEKEIYGAYRGMSKWGKLMVQAMQQNKDKHTCKISLRMDNSTATKQWIDMQNPGIIDFAGPKEMRFMGWAEHMAFTREMNIDASFIPGNMNSFADLVSRIANKLGDAALRKKNREFDVTVAHTEVYTFDSGSAEHKGELPDKYSARHIKMTKSEAEEVRRAQLHDVETVHKVNLGDIAKCVLDDGSGVTPEVAQKIMPWIGRTYFKITHPETSVELVYTPVSQQRVHWESEDATRILVLQVPNRAKVKITSANELFEETNDDAPEWITKQIELKGQLLSLCHDMQVPHPAVTESVIMLKRMGHWSGMLKDMVNHIDECADCAEQRKHREEAGAGIVAAQRFKVLQLDHYLLSKEQAKICGVELVLTITDTASRTASFEVAKQQTSLATAKIIWIRWIPFYGVPDMIITDPHPGFAADVMGHLMTFMGIKERVLAAEGSKSKTGMVESRHNELTAALSDGFAKGAIQNEEDLLMYLATAKKTHDQDREGARITPFELVTGQKATSRMNLALVRPVTEIHEVLQDDDRQFCEKIKMYTEQLLNVNLWKRDDTARTNARRRHQQLGKNAAHTHYQMKEGDEVSFQGKLYRLGKTTGAATNKPISAQIIRKNGTSKTVPFKELRPAATPRPVNYIRKEMPATGSFIIWAGQEHLQAGVVTETEQAAQMVTVHEHSATEGSSVYWLPIWKTQGGKFVRAKNAPTGTDAKMVRVDAAKIQVTGELTATFALSIATRKEAMAKMAL